jgi:hypothetical protein
VVAGNKYGHMRNNSIMRKRYALDASVLASIVNSDDIEHFSCYSFFRNLHDHDKAIWVVPGLIFFEFQATQSRRYREGFCPAFTDTWLRLIMGQEGCHGTEAKVFSGVQA